MAEVSPYSRLKILGEFIMQSRSRDQIIAFLSSNVDPNGDAAGVSIAVLDYEGYLTLPSRFGFSDSVPIPGRVHISTDVPLARALSTMETQLIDSTKLFEEYKGIPNTIKKESEYHYVGALPITASIAYGFFFQSDLSEFPHFKEYLECIGSILLIWEKLNDPDAIFRLSKVIPLNKALTLRQETILEFIKKGRTNGSIAADMGYSESLIRQETIVIYKKLGVHGRKEILESRIK